jgi:hypothetical protein
LDWIGSGFSSFGQRCQKEDENEEDGSIEVNAKMEKRLEILKYVIYKDKYE